MSPDSSLTCSTKTYTVWDTRNVKEIHKVDTNLKELSHNILATHKITFALKEPEQMKIVVY